jgi:hypothetical protein
MMFQITVHYVGGNTESFDFAEVESARMFMRERDQSDQVAFTTVSLRPRLECLGDPAGQRGSLRVGD